MADNNLLEQMLEHLVNEDKEKAEELFHQYVVEKSREIYETLLDENVEDLEEEDEEEDEDKEEVEESFLELDLDEEDDDTVDPADDLINDVDDEEEMDMDDDEGEEDTDELFQDLESIVDELQAKFDELQGNGEDDMDMDMDAEETEEDFSFESKEEYDELATIKEYVDRVAGGHGAEQKGSAESADNKKSTIDNMKNDMGGTASNLNQAEEAKGGSESGLSSNSPKDMNTGNVNTPGSKNATKMSNEPGHGAEKKGSAEQADNKNSLFK